MCRLNKAICNSKQILNNDKCRCECKEDLVDKINCDKGYLWNPSNCECECDKSCGSGEYLDYKNCVCRKNIVDRLIDECTNTTTEESNDILVNSGNFPNSSDKTFYFSLFFNIFTIIFNNCWCFNLFLLLQRNYIQKKRCS